MRTNATHLGTGARVTVAQDAHAHAAHEWVDYVFENGRGGTCRVDALALDDTMTFTATSSAGWGYRIMPTTITDDYVTGTLKGWGPHRGRTIDVPRDAVRTHDGYDMGETITIYRTNVTA